MACVQAIFNAASVSFLHPGCCLLQFFLVFRLLKNGLSVEVASPNTGVNIQNLDPCGIGINRARLLWLSLGLPLLAPDDPSAIGTQ